MMSYNALSGFNETDVPLLQGKLSFVAKLASSTNQEEQFGHILDLRGLPKPVFGQTRIDATQLLKVRESDECRAFRD